MKIKITAICIVDLHEFQPTGESTVDHLNADKGLAAFERLVDLACSDHNLTKFTCKAEPYVN